VLGLSARTRNERVADRAGAVRVAPESLDDCGDRAAVLVPSDVIIDLPLFPLPPLIEPTWLVGDLDAAVLAGPARDVQAYAGQIDRARSLPRLAVSAAAVLNVSSAASRRRAAWNVLRRTGKPTDGWVSRNFGRPISRAISFVLLPIGVKANHASILTLLVGLAAGLLALRPGYVPLVGTALLFKLTSVLDGVDGEIARATLSESKRGALLDTVADQLTYVFCFTGVTIGWIREGAGRSALLWTLATAVALAFSLMRGWRFVSRHAPPGAELVFIDRAVRRAARDSGRAALKVASAMFTLLRRDAFATLFFFIALMGQRALIPAACVLGIVLANVTLSTYSRELVAAAMAIQRPVPQPPA
jgi:phosphatidylglycerophosphate synthase